jgi:Pentapeptide repeats (8 copies)
MSWLPLAAAVALVLIIVIVLGYRLTWGWTGLPGKTLWDWLQLLVIPVALAGLAFLLNSSQSSREQRREDERTARQRVTAADNAREETLRVYLTQMSGFMLDRKLPRSAPDAGVRAVARTVTLTTLRRLNGRRRGLLVRFLRAARLVERSDPKVRLTGANLQSARLKGGTLVDADLSGANLTKANLSQTTLIHADLRRANLPKANLRWANLQKADLDGADLRWAGLERADLRGADLRGADLRRADYLRRADFRGAKYDSTTRWPPGFDPSRPARVPE